MFKLIIAFLLICFADCFPNRAKFGETCGDGIRCDARASLTCINNTCGCVKADEMTYDNGMTKCVVLSGERCSYTAVEINQDEKWTESLDCVEKAQCNDDGYCECNSDYFEDFERFCASRKGYGENCTSNEHCQAKLNCENNTCVCKEGIGNVHDPIRGGCVLQEGEICSQDSNTIGTCVSNAACSLSFNSFSWKPGYCRCNKGYERGINGLCQPIYKTKCDKSIPCVNNLVCNSTCDCPYPFIQEYNESKQMCECSTGYKDFNGQCLAKYNQSCSNYSGCADNLVCVDRKCSCPFPNQNYNDMNGCVGDIGSPCNLLVGFHIMAYPCVENAYCNYFSATSECVCNEGFIEVEGKRCEVAYGQPCSAAANCDSVAGLVCKNEVCGCPYLQDYDEKVGKCRGLVGASCEPGQDFACVEGATCNWFEHRYRVSRWNPVLPVGACRCIKGMQLSHERKCIPSQSTTTSKSAFTTISGKVTEAKAGKITRDSHAMVPAINSHHSESFL